ncbi:phosphopantothenoylcysteine decarboxylase [Planctomycetota bacterium]
MSPANNNVSGAKPLAGKSVLVTGGPTRAYIDPVRFISNISTGSLGVIIAAEFHRRGAQVQLIMGPGTAEIPPYISTIRVETAGEMLAACKQELQARDYDVAIFAAAVSDFIPDQEAGQKIRSGENITIKLKPCKKIIREVDKVKRSGTRLFKVGFKLETTGSDAELIAAAHKSLQRNGCQLVVANQLKDIGPDRHRALIIDLEKNHIEVLSKSEIAAALAGMISKRL